MDRARLALRARLGPDTQALLEIVADEATAGLWEDALALLDEVVMGEQQTATGARPLGFYWRGWCLDQSGRADEGREAFRLAAMEDKAQPDFCFPFRWEEEAVLRRAMEVNAGDRRAPYLLGNLLFDRQPEAAIRAWEQARGLDAEFALVHRNLGLAYGQTRGELAEAVASLETAVRLAPGEARFLYELDVQYEAAGVAVARRLAMLQERHSVADQRDDALTREIQLLAVSGDPSGALRLLQGRRFHNWEGSDDIRDLHVDVRLAQGRALLKAGRVAEAQEAFAAALGFPDNLEVGRPHRDSRVVEVRYHLGLAAEAAGNQDPARAHWEECVKDPVRGASAAQYCQGQALAKLGRTEDARKLFEGLAKEGRQRLERGGGADYFAKFGQRQAARVREGQAWYLVALGEHGRGREAECREALAKARERHPAQLTVLLD